MKKFCLITLLVAAVNAHAVAPLPVDSWEAWILALRQGNPGPRPDKQKPETPLPLWVDCHLSWIFDHNFMAGMPKGKTASKLVLRATPALCKGQPEEWAKIPSPPTHPHSKAR